MAQKLRIIVTNNDKTNQASWSMNDGYLHLEATEIIAQIKKTEGKFPLVTSFYDHSKRFQRCEKAYICRILPTTMVPIIMFDERAFVQQHETFVTNLSENQSNIEILTMPPRKDSLVEQNYIIELANACISSMAQKLRIIVTNNDKTNQASWSMNDGYLHLEATEKFTLVACVFSATLVVCTCNRADENIIRVAKLGLDPKCTDICRKETHSCKDPSDFEEDDKISETCMIDANPCYIRCTGGEPDENQGINNIKVSDHNTDEDCVNKCRPGIPECTTTGEYISEDCTHNPKMIDCYSVCMGAVEPEV
ncbi:hypothetical protein CAPTEDRAFT_194108 [Capitella teleta]|uniref:Uncharacterized protein n=1 Tax=Capitella teleta TaxID=283909 RepID=R7U4Q6_CAPTE|nr:hypothetical protein CAPTEDRAFT_194108 [Capitella teleta]|eukprot:ELU00914.1 hypothetical protein CAPTEDRAFT_194108 [Capitella teleta]